MSTTSEHIADQEVIAFLRSERTADKGMRIVIQQYGEMLYRKIRGITISHEDADDVMQKTLIKVLRYIGQFKGESKLSTWMYQIATREALTHMRTMQRRRTEPMELGFAAAGQSDALDLNQAESLLLEALEGLPPVQRQVFELRYYDSMPFKKMSELTSKSEGSLKASYHHAAKKIEQFIKSKAIL